MALKRRREPKPKVTLKFASSFFLSGGGALLQFQGSHRSSVFAMVNRGGEARRRVREGVAGGDKDVDESARRTERSCHSCAADAVADTIAVCCCPCAVVSQLFLAVLKVPSALGSRCLQIARRRGGALKKDGGGKNGESGTISVGESREKKADLRVESLVEISSAWNEAEEERAWKEMYLAGHWGFGRVSVSVSISEEKN
ncbi:hypothetical protein HPP92_008038 [Vanilla planifolia]|uniref:Uncharacterized protein n=1 Tax=Vanilla planifolia TaxID=51239 RepID=A0A835RMY2_VANPL|nr:hypothetical protein HPP92_008038 [Vanilla planifolia]